LESNSEKTVDQFCCVEMKWREMNAQSCEHSKTGLLQP
jgi:hypothetical protein